MIDFSGLPLGTQIKRRDEKVVTLTGTTGMLDYPISVAGPYGNIYTTSNNGQTVKGIESPSDLIAIDRAETNLVPEQLPLSFMQGGIKHDSNKTRLELLPFAALEAVGDVLAQGAKKYDDHNWRKGFTYSRLIGASLRHIFAFAKGEDKDPESGLSHLAHAACCILFLLEHTIEGLGQDNRHTTLKGA